MEESHTRDESKDVYTIAHATDLLADGGIAFAHGVALARDAGAALYSLHANPETPDTQRRMPRAEELLGRWSQGSGGGEVPELEHHRTTHTCCEDPVDTLLDALGQIEPDLLVVGTRSREGFERFFHESVSMALARNGATPTLFVPIGAEGFVDPGDGRLELRRLLVPIEGREDADSTLEVLVELLDRLGVDDVELIALHVGDDDLLERLSLPERPGWRWTREQQRGETVEAIAGCAREHDVDLVVMSTRGQDRLLDVFRGPQTERVVRHALGPVLSIPL
jgi:nucleotide-binding universal stress UspA family protein